MGTAMSPIISVRLRVIGSVLRFEVHEFVREQPDRDRNCGVGVGATLDGPGLDPDAPHDGVGLRNMRDRLDALDGRFEIVSAPGRGTAIVGVVPIV